MSVATVIDGIRYSLVGMLFGTGVGTATEVIADEITHMLDLKESAGHTGQPLTSTLAEAMIRTTMFSVGLVLSTRVYEQLGGRLPDPTDAAMFAYAYSTAQDNLYWVLVDLGKRLKRELIGSGGSCCGSCSSGKTCDGKK